MEQKEKQIELDLVGLFHYLKKWIAMILAVTLIFGAAGFLYAGMFLKPVYVAETRLYVLSRSANMGLTTSDMQLSDQLLKDCEVLITGKNVTREVVKQLDLDISPSALGGKISVSAPKETRVLQITVTDGNPNRAAAIANKVCEVAAQQLQSITADPVVVSQLYEAEVPQAPSGPNATRYMMVCALVGLLLTVGILTVVFMWDDSIRSEEDVERYLGLSVLGVIPDSEDIDTTPRQTPKKRRKPAFMVKNKK